jgi:hypothetical protein
MWVTFKLRSSNNLNIRTLDGSYVDEAAMQGHPRGYYPYHPMSAEGSYKHPESQIYNRGFAKSVSDRWNVELPDVPHIKNFFKTRIMYSDIHINDAYKNGFRVFRGTNYRDYTREYGEIVKLISLESRLLIVFEHGIALVDVNERTLAGQGAGGMVYIKYNADGFFGCLFLGRINFWDNACCTGQQQNHHQKQAYSSLQNMLPLISDEINYIISTIRNQVSTVEKQRNLSLFVAFAQTF